MPRTALEHFSAIDGYVTPDTAKALKALMEMAEAAGMAINPQPVIGSYAPAGRSVSVRLDGSQAQLNKLWSIAVPLGFTPWSRYPIPGTVNETLYFLGPWQAVLDRLCAEGRGHLSWPAMCKAAWADATLELNENSEIEELNIFVQAQLHRLGFNAGNLDGVMGTRTLQSLATLGLESSSTFEQTLELAIELSGSETKTQPESSEKGPWRGQIVGHGLASIATHGQVAVVRTARGAALTIEGPGRVIADFVPA